MSRTATIKEQEKIDEANKILAAVDLSISECKDKGGGAVTPSKAP